MSTTLKRPLSEIETELEAAERTKAETKDRVKRLRTERDAHAEFQARVRRNEVASLEDELPPYLFDALVRHPIDPDKYGALCAYDIEHVRHSREVKDGIYADQLLITARFEKKTVNYELDTDNGSWEYPVIVEPKSIKKQRPTMTQQQVWDAALRFNQNDVGLAFIVVCAHCYRLIDDFEDTVVDAPLGDVELYCRLQCKLPHVTADELREFYALDAYHWLAKGDPLDRIDMDEQARRVNATRNLFDTTLFKEARKVTV